MNSRRCISAPKIRGQHCIGSNEYFDRGSNRHQNHCRSAQPMSLMGLVSRVTPVHTAVRNCTRDEGRSFEAKQSGSGLKPLQAAVVKSDGGEDLCSILAVWALAFWPWLFAPMFGSARSPRHRGRPTVGFTIARIIWQGWKHHRLFGSIRWTYGLALDFGRPEREVATDRATKGW
jgi:hypothetical protein